LETENEKVERREEGLDISMKQVMVVIGLGFAITLAVVVGKQMSTEAMAVVVGVVCGVAAGIPTSVLLLVALTRKQRGQDQDVEQDGRQHRYPPVVVIQGGTSHSLPQAPQAGYWPSPAPGPVVQRQFHVVGEDDLIVEG
jgi:hypothetical protein